MSRNAFAAQVEEEGRREDRLEEIRQHRSEKADARLAHPVPAICPWCSTKIERYQQSEKIGTDSLHRLCALEFRLQEAEAKIKELFQMVPA